MERKICKNKTLFVSGNSLIFSGNLFVKEYRLCWVSALVRTRFSFGMFTYYEKVTVRTVDQA